MDGLVYQQYPYFTQLEMFYEYGTYRLLFTVYLHTIYICLLIENTFLLFLQ